MSLELCTIPTACERLAISRASLYRAINRGELLPVKLGRATRLRASDLELWVQSHVGKAA